jgi:hypothetical protein
VITDIHITARDTGYMRRTCAYIEVLSFHRVWWLSGPRVGVPTADWPQIPKRPKSNTTDRPKPLGSAKSRSCIVEFEEKFPCR